MTKEITVRRTVEGRTFLATLKRDHMGRDFVYLWERIQHSDGRTDQYIGAAYWYQDTICGLTVNHPNHNVPSKAFAKLDLALCNALTKKGL